MIETGRVVLARDVQRPDVQNDDARQHKRQQIVQREKPVQRHAGNRISAPQPFDDAGAKALTNRIESREQVGDDGDAPEAHLAPRQRVTQERRCHHDQQDDDAEDPQHFARRLIRPVIETAENMNVNGDKEHRSADRVNVADQPAEVDVAADMLDRIEGRRCHSS